MDIVSGFQGMGKEKKRGPDSKVTNSAQYIDFRLNSQHKAIIGIMSISRGSSHLLKTKRIAMCCEQVILL